MDDDASLIDRLRRHVGRRYGPVFAWDRVNEPMIRHWCEALEYDFAPYREAAPGGAVAPPTMLPVWLMPGLRRRFPPGSDMRDNREIFRELEADGYSGIIATNCEQEYDRRLRPGERIASTYEVETVSDEKRTKFGPGFFITFLQRFIDEAEAQVGTMRIRILRFRPQPKPAPRPAPPVPAMSQDTAFFWEGLRQRRLLIQRCTACGTLRHPPGPACTECHSLDGDSQEASGRGVLHSFTVMHHPQLPAFDYPHPVGLVALEEGVRLVVPLLIDDPAKLAIGMELQVVFDDAAEGDRLPRFRPVAAG